MALQPSDCSGFNGEPRRKAYLGKWLAVNPCVAAVQLIGERRIENSVLPGASVPTNDLRHAPA